MRSRRPAPLPSALAAVALLFAAALPRSAAAAEDDEPPAAVFAGRPVPRRELHEVLAARTLRLESGAKMLDQFTSDLVAEAERRRRGVEVSEDRLREFVDRTARQTLEQMRRHGEGGPDVTFETVLEERGATLEEFRRQARHYLALQEMAAKDLAATGEVSAAQIDLWLRELKDGAGVVVDRAQLPGGVVARVGGRNATAEEFGRWLVSRRPKHEVVGVVVDLAFEHAVAAAAAAAGTVLPPAAAEEEVKRLEVEFLDQPGIAGSGVSFADWLEKATGLSPDRLVRDRPFLTNLLARRLKDAEITDAEVAERYDLDPLLWGESARVRRILVRGVAGETSPGPGRRPMSEARRLAARAVDLVEGGTAFEEVARTLSDDPEASRGRPFDVTPVMRSTILPQEALDRIFETRAGELVGPLDTLDGVLLVRVDRRTPAPPREEALRRVRAELAARRVGEWRLALRSDPALVLAEDLR